MHRDDIDAALAARLVAAQFPQWAGLTVTDVAHSGWDNRTFRLGADMSVRLPTGPFYAQGVAKEQRWLPVLGPQLPLPIPVPLGAGRPTADYPYPWSVYRWLPGTPLATTADVDLVRLAGDLAAFLSALYAIRPADGPPPGEHNWFRGGSPGHYDDQTRAALAEWGSRAPADALDMWERGLATAWTRDPVWFHGDVAEGNLLVVDGRLSAVIDFGTSGVGDPACDLVAAWTIFDGPSRAAFVAGIDVDDDTWDRARAWALWKALITRGQAPDGPPQRTVDRLFAGPRSGRP